jgi:3-methyl-2-oxobutanoate hydroxymethyltransferase
MSAVRAGRVTIPALRAMKEAGDKIACIVAWDTQLARVADGVGVEIVSVGDSVGVNLWGHTHPLEVTLDEMLVVAKAVRRGVERALVSCDFPYGPLQTGDAVATAVRLAKEAGVDMVKLDGAEDYPDAVEAVTRAGIPVFAQFGITPQTALRYGGVHDARTPTRVPDEMIDELVSVARRLEAAGAVALNFTNSGPVVGAAVVAAVDIPVLGGMGGGPWLDGRIRMGVSAIGYAATGVGRETDSYANVATIAHDAFSRLVADVRAAEHICGDGVRPDR